MQRAPKPALDEVSHPKPRKKTLPQPQSLFQMKHNDKWSEMPHSSLKAEKATKRMRNMKSEPSPSFQHSDRSTTETLQDSSLTNSDYRTLRHKYLLLEEDSCQLGKELSEIEAEVKSLEDEKHSLLDKLVVLEGLMDASELQAEKPS